MKRALFLFSIFCFMFSTPAAEAAELYFGSHSKEVGVGKSFEIGVFLNTDGQSVNAAEGKIIFPANLEAVDVQKGNSIINLWVEEPYLEQAGEIRFAGIVPGGYVGGRGYLLSIIFKAKQEGLVALTTNNERILLNDGQGTEALTRRAPLTLKVVATTTVEEFLPPYDPDPPESFVPVIGRDPNIFDNQYFLAFVTQDKGSGVVQYQVQESRSSKPNLRKWQVSESPYLLQDQDLHSYVFVKAIDKAGNERVETLPPQQPLPWYTNYWIWILITLVIGCLLYLYRNPILRRPKL